MVPPGSQAGGLPDFTNGTVSEGLFRAMMRGFPTRWSNSNHCEAWPVSLTARFFRGK